MFNVGQMGLIVIARRKMFKHDRGMATNQIIENCLSRQPVIHKRYQLCMTFSTKMQLYLYIFQNTGQQRVDFMCIFAMLVYYFMSTTEEEKQ